ncbi:MAG: tRNA (5-methylaminomethyl-2-thiouridine)(34)-methyltransferase MnmD [Hoeflea sp.]|uniref:tRNA (5-methylaminomethyl-2-thiouridine)(34)-methyltransferase MnmD n=1 Tax=Hoeflea sp. TaxID=1940281 RepID=UPI002730F04C|nr:tRNA (5-methylaminomethyl-2-thiouridine)(34)-methyltransferase MnmD [Hoeflea sp.]MDP2119826.1 tRNA (5-methylaminomethyl-2-thiouridine)(34)-methyltransferase MnmD [Hoeflea sp.]
MIDPSAPDDDTSGQPVKLSWHEGDMPYSEEFGDFYYSRADGRDECRHVFLGGNGLPGRFATGPHFVIGELGFGTGLNFLETWSAWETTAPDAAVLEFHSFELRPLKRSDMMRALSAWPDLDEKSSRLAAAWPDQPAAGISMDFQSTGRSIRLRVHAGLALDTLETLRFRADAWYLDGFSPSRNPDMWSAELMRLVASRTREGGTFATYSAAGWVRRNLQAAGFTVEKRQGHAGKRDMSAGHLGAPSLQP